MLEIYNTTQEEMVFRLTGKNDIDVRNFGEMLINTENILKKITSISDKGALLELKIVAIQKGSFEFNLLALLGEAPRLFESALTAYNLIEAFLELVNFKNWLKGEEIKTMVNNGDNVIINKVDGSSHNIVNNLNINIFADEKKIETMDKLFVALGKSMPFDRDITFKTRDRTHNYTSKVKEHLEMPINIQCKEDETIERNIVTRDIVIKKPDLEMTSKWQIYIHKKLYQVDIVDEEFKRYVVSGRFNAHNGTKLRVDLEEVAKYNAEKGVTDIDYTSILKVHPTIDSNLRF